MLNKEFPFVTPLENESFNDYKLRVYILKSQGKLELTWVQIAEMFRQTYGIDKHDTTWLRDSQRILCAYNTNNDSDNLDDILLTIKKERYKLADERTQNNAYIRRLSR
jgi:hypothetical protein